jgi:hypothetical protein
MPTDVNDIWTMEACDNGCIVRNLTGEVICIVPSDNRTQQGAALIAQQIAQEHHVSVQLRRKGMWETFQ